MKVTYVLPSLGYTGASLVVYRLLDGLVERGHDAAIVTPFGRLEWRQGMRDAVARDPGHGYVGAWGAARRLQHALRSRIPGVEEAVQTIRWRDPLARVARDTRGILSRWQASDVTIATHSLTTYAVALLGDETRGFYHMQGLETEFFARPDLRRLARLSYQLPLRQMANSSWLRDRVRPLSGRSDPPALLLPGLDQGVFHADETTLEKFGSTGPLVVVSYADPRPVKGWTESVSAMRRVRERLRGRREVDWYVFGSLPASAMRSVDVHPLGLLGHDRLADLYRRAHVFFLSSLTESFPLQPLEAMACGAAVVTTSPGVSDYAEDGGSALVVEPGDPQALADAISRVALDDALQRRLARNGMLRARQRTWEAAASQLETIIGARPERQAGSASVPIPQVT